MDYYETEEQKNLMDYVGKTLVRMMDVEYEYWLKVFQSEDKLRHTNQIKARNWYQRLSGEDKKMLLSIIKSTAFNMVYALLMECQDSQANFPDALFLAARKDGIEYPNISYESDGLCGEMFLDDGWYEMLSKYFVPDDRLWLI